MGQCISVSLEQWLKLLFGLSWTLWIDEDVCLMEETVKILCFTSSKLTEVSVLGDWMEVLFLLESEMNRWSQVSVKENVKVIALKQSTVMLT